MTLKLEPERFDTWFFLGAADRGEAVRVDGVTESARPPRLPGPISEGSTGSPVVADSRPTEEMRWHSRTSR
jgi:hypothetical protein